MRYSIWMSFFCVLAAVLLAGCGIDFLKGPIGRIITTEQRFSLPHGNFSNFWETHDLILSYDGIRTDNHLKISGSVELTGGLQHFLVVQGFYLQALFLDPEGRVLSVKRLFTAPHMASIDIWTFQRELELPKNAASISFSYSGEAKGAAMGHESDSFSFWMISFE